MLRPAGHSTVQVNCHLFTLYDLLTRSMYALWHSQRVLMETLLAVMLREGWPSSRLTLVSSLSHWGRHGQRGLTERPRIDMLTPVDARIDPLKDLTPAEMYVVFASVPQIAVIAH